MSNPQQPELARTRQGATDQGSAKAKARDAPPADTGPEGPIPEDNAPGHHPEVEQDKPTGPPPRPKRAASKAAERKGAKATAEGKAKAGAGKKGPGKKPAAKRATSEQPEQPAPVAASSDVDASDSRAAAVISSPSPLRAAKAPTSDPIPGRMRFPFAFEARLLPLGAVFGVLPFTTGVEVTADELRVRFGPWSLVTPLANITGAELTGPYQLHRVAGPAHISLADGGVTFATNTEAGACLTFRHPVPAALPMGVLRHPSATITVAQPQALIDAIQQRVDRQL